MRNFKNWLDGYLEYTKGSEPLPIFHKWVGISLLAAAVERKVWLVWDEPTYVNFYIVIVAPSGSRKGTALRFGRDLLSEIDVKLSSDATTRRALTSALERSVSLMDTPDGQVPHSSLTVYSEEFTVFLGYDNRQLLSYLCDWYDCRDPWEYSTEHSGCNYIRNVWVNIIGATTPTLLQDTLISSAIGGGLTSRMIFIYGGGKGKIVVFPFLEKVDLEFREALVSDLREINHLSGEMIPSQDFLELWEEWYPKQCENPPFTDPRFGGYLDRRAKHVLKISMLLSVAESNELEVKASHLKRGIKMLEEAEVDMRKALGGAGTSPISVQVESVYNLLVEQGEMTYKELFSLIHHDLDKDGLDKVLTNLVVLGKVRFERDNEKPFELRKIIPVM